MGCKKLQYETKLTLHRGGKTQVGNPLNLSRLPQKSRVDTGYYYYGARYYNPKVSNWLSVDPLWEETGQPYQYANQNPLKYIDPTGMAGESTTDDYKMDKNGNIVLTKKTDDKTDRLISKENGDVISKDIQKGVLSDNINIKRDGLDVNGSPGKKTDEKINSAVDMMLNISIYEQKEVSMGIYGNKDEKMLHIQPYENNLKHEVLNDDLPSSRFGMKLEVDIHTHPGFGTSPNGKQLGSGKPSFSDSWKRPETGVEGRVYGRNGWSRFNRGANPDNVRLNPYPNTINKVHLKNTLKWKKNF